jgi:hypothetical protein
LTPPPITSIYIVTLIPGIGIDAKFRGSYMPNTYTYILLIKLGVPNQKGERGKIL